MPREEATPGSGLQCVCVGGAVGSDVPLYQQWTAGHGSHRREGTFWTKSGPSGLLTQMEPQAAGKDSGLSGLRTKASFHVLCSPKAGS